MFSYELMIDLCRYLGRFDEEMSIIQSVKPYEKQKYASRRDQLRHTMEDERNEYNGCGFGTNLVEI